MQHVQHRHRVRFGRVAADVHRALGVLHVVVRVRHRAVAPRVGYAGDRRRVADPRLVIAVVRAPERHELAHQVSLLVAVLRAADPEHRVGARFLAQREQLVADLVDRLLPADLLVLAVDQLHRRLQPILAVAVLARRRALRAMGAEVERRIEHRVLPRPYAIFDGGVDRAADRAMRADGALHFGLGGLAFLLRLGLADGAIGKLACERPGPGNETRALQKRPPVHRRILSSDEAAKRGPAAEARIAFLGQQHDPSSS